MASFLGIGIQQSEKKDRKKMEKRDEISGGISWSERIRKEKNKIFTFNMGRRVDVGVLPPP